MTSVHDIVQLSERETLEILKFVPKPRPSQRGGYAERLDMGTSLVDPRDE